MRALPTFLPSSRSVAERYVDVVLSWNSFLSPLLAPFSYFFVLFSGSPFFRFPERIPVLIRLYMVCRSLIRLDLRDCFYLSYCFDFSSFDFFVLGLLLD